MNISQNWSYPKSHPKGKPIFFVNGKRVSLMRGAELVFAGELGSAEHLKTWFAENDIIDPTTEKRSL